MTPNKPEPEESRRHHFLFHIFRMDKEANPMPCDHAQVLLQYLRRMFTDTQNNKKERD